jgi:phage repressor protein C with HTH and peptisase S24 domain
LLSNVNNNVCLRQKQQTLYALTMAGLAENLVIAMKKRGLTQRELARRIANRKPGISPQAIQHLTSGRSSTSKWLPDIAKELQTTVEALTSENEIDLSESGAGLLGKQETTATVQRINGVSFAFLPSYDIDGSAGTGLIASDYPDKDWYAFPNDWLRTITKAPLDRLALIRVSGDSMWQTLHNGDYVLVDRTKKSVARGGIYVFQFEGELLIKRLEKKYDTGELQVISDNPVYPPQLIANADNLAVVGRVVWISRALG